MADPDPQTSEPAPGGPPYRWAPPGQALPRVAEVFVKKDPLSLLDDYSPGAILR